MMGFIPPSFNALVEKSLRGLTFFSFGKTSHGIAHYSLLYHIYHKHNVRIIRVSPLSVNFFSICIFNAEYNITVITPRFVSNFEVSNRAVDMDSRALLTCYPRGSFCLMIFRGSTNSGRFTKLLFRAGAA